MKKLLFVILILMFLHSCDFYVHFTSKNDSSENIHFYVGRSYPDTLPPEFGLNRMIEARSAYLWYIDGIDLKRNFFGDEDTLSMFIVSCDTVSKYGWEDVRANHRVLVRYDLSYPDFMELNTIIPYPPTSQMSQMKMWPPYQQVIATAKK